MPSIRYQFERWSNRPQPNLRDSSIWRLLSTISGKRSDNVVQFKVSNRGGIIQDSMNSPDGRWLGPDTTRFHWCWSVCWGPWTKTTCFTCYCERYFDVCDDPNGLVYDNSEYDIAMADISPGYNDRTFAISCLACINIATHVRDDVGQDNSIMGRRISSVIGEKGRHGKHNYESISRKWGIGVDYSRNTLNVTTQKWVCTGIGPLTRR